MEIALLPLCRLSDACTIILALMEIALLECCIADVVFTKAGKKSSGGPCTSCEGIQSFFG